MRSGARSARHTPHAHLYLVIDVGATGDLNCLIEDGATGKRLRLPKSGGPRPVFRLDDIHSLCDDAQQLQ